MLLTRIFLCGCFVFLVCGCSTTSPAQQDVLFRSFSKPQFPALLQEQANARQFALSNQSQAAQLQANEAETRLTDAQNNALDERLRQVLVECNIVISGLGQKAVEQEKNSFWLSMSGLVAGSVFAPAAIASGAAAHRVAIAVASGWAGATNLAGQTLRTVGLAGDAVATTRNQITVRLNEAIVDATDTGKTYDTRFAAIQRAQAACITFAVTVPGAVPSLPSSK